MKLHKYLFIAAGLALAAGFTACDEGGLDYEYEPAATPTGAQVYFDSADNGMAVSLSDGQTEIKVPIYRVNGDGDLSVSLTLTDESGLLSLPGGGVTFAAGQKTAEVTLSVNFAGVTANTAYPFSLAVAAADASEYAVASINATFEFAPWSEWEKLGTGTYTFNGAWEGYASGLDIMWRKSLVDTKNVEFSIPDLWEIEGYNMTFSGREAQTKDGKTVYVLNVPEQATGDIYEELNAMIFCADLYNYTGQDMFQTASIYDPEIGEFALYMIYYIPDKGRFGDGAYEYFQLDGFTTYKIDLTEAGHYISPDGTDNALVQCHLSDGIASAQYTAVNGSLSDAQVEQVVAAILDGSIESKTTEESGYLSFAFPEQGTYTVVVVGFNEAGEQACVETIVINYIPVGASAPNVDEDPDWTTLGYCAYTDDFLTAFTDQIGPETADVKIQISNDDADVLRLVNAYGPDGYGFPLVNATENYFMNVYIVDEAGHVVLDTDDQGVQPIKGYGNFYTTSMAAQEIASGKSMSDVIASGICGTYLDGFIHFPEQQLMAGLIKDGKLGGWIANKNGAFEIDMSSLISEQRAHRTAVRRPVRVYGNPTTTMQIKKRSFLGNVTTEQVIKHRTTHLSTTPLR